MKEHLIETTCRNCHRPIGVLRSPFHSDAQTEETARRLCEHCDCEQAGQARPTENEPSAD